MIRTLRAAIVDDEPLSRARLVRLLSEAPAVEVVGEYEDASRAEELLAVEPEVLFLDVRMPGANGFELLESLSPARRPLVVFVTAYSRHAVRAFDTAAVDYLVKPVSGPRLQLALERVRARLPVEPPAYVRRLTVSEAGRIRVVKVADIEHAEACGNYVELHLPGRTLLIRETLNRLHGLLDPEEFVRIHRSRLVRIGLIDQLEPLGGNQYQVRLCNGVELITGRAYRAAIYQALGLKA